MVQIYPINAITLFVTWLTLSSTNAFIHNHALHKQLPKSSSPLPMANFFENILKEAFSNDESLVSTSDQSQGQIDAATGDETTSFQTTIQRKWLDKAKGVGAPIPPEALENTQWKVKLYLAGIPDQDPSNNLYGRKVNISQRDRNLDIGAQMDKEPTVVLDVVLDADGVCRTSPSQFTTDRPGQWKLSPDQTSIRFSFDTVGFTRTVQTTGTITKIYWSKEDEQTTKTSSTYTIPARPVYGDAQIGYGSIPGRLIMKEGLLRVEEKRGLLGATTIMKVCGKFEADMVMED